MTDRAHKELRSTISALRERIRILEAHIMIIGMDPSTLTDPPK